MEFQLSTDFKEKSGNALLQANLKCVDKACLPDDAESCRSDDFMAKIHLEWDPSERVALIKEWWTDDFCGGKGAEWLNTKLRGAYAAMMALLIGQAFVKTDMTPDDTVLLRPRVRADDDMKILLDFYGEYGMVFDEKSGMMRAKVSELMKRCKKVAMSPELENALIEA